MAKKPAKWTSIPPAWSGEVTDRASVLPIGRYDTPEGPQVSFAVPGMIADPVSSAYNALSYAFGGAQDPNAPKGYVSQNALIEGATDAAGTVGGTAMGGSAIVPAMRAPAGALGMFAGKRSLTADHNALRRAQDMTARALQAGNKPNRELIWQETGWFQGPDGNWKYEIDDSKATISKLPAEGERRPFFKSPEQPGYMRHDKLRNTGYHWDGGLDVYSDPALKDTRIAGYYRSRDGSIGVNPEIGDIRKFANVGQERSTALHEAQHLIQDKEDWSPGANTAQFTYQQFVEDQAAPMRRERLALEEKMSNNEALAYENFNRVRAAFEQKYGPTLAKAPENVLVGLGEAEAKLSDDVLKATRYARQERQMRNRMLDNPEKYENELQNYKWNRYQRNLGETEARAVQARMRMTPEQRKARPPWMDYEYWDDAEWYGKDKK